jgi:hypothetical protein
MSMLKEYYLQPDAPDRALVPDSAAGPDLPAKDRIVAP